ncbi:TetR/AcrR family transcriptional regulator [Methanobacterium oryzae]|uniref:TetR/AcrR family transcriptional regulator n=1 Tax=Methanobacterium oryzae TaxID=69540 RepID=UPI003D1F37F5
MSIVERREREKKQRQQDIINAAEKLFFSKGFDNVSMRDIASEVDLSKATLYLYFQNKESLFFAIVLRGTRILNSMIRETVYEKEKGIDKIAAYRDAYNEFTQQYHDYIQIYNYFQSGRFNLATEKIIKKGNKNKSSKNGQNNAIPYVSECAMEILKLRKERFSILCDSVQKGIDDMTIRKDINPIEATILLSAIFKNLSDIPEDREKMLKSRGIDNKKYLKDVGELIQHMIMNKK